MDLFLCWLVAPAGLLLATIGLSLLLERLTGFPIPWTLRPATGMAIAIVLSQFGTATSTTARLTLPAILLLAILGLLFGRGVAGGGPNRAEVAIAATVFLLFALPFLVIGEATWAGYIKLDDTATWMALTDHVFEYGRGLGDLPPSTHNQVLIDYLGGTYPIGGFVPAALMAKISGQDVAFTMQPSMAFAAAVLGLGLFELARRLLPSVGTAAAIAILASLSSALLGYYFWGGVKELVTAALLPLAPLLAASAARSGWPRYAWAPLGIAFGAMVVALGPGGALWVIPPLLPAAYVVLRERGGRALTRLALSIAAFSLALVLPVLFGPTGAFDPLNNGINQDAGLGNLFGPLNPLHVAGIWPAIDFRFDAHLEPAVLVLAALCLAIAAATLVAAVLLQRDEGVPLVGYVGGGAVGALLIAHLGSPWVDGKAIATLSPGVLAAALIGIAMLGLRTRFRLEAAAAGTLLAAVVLWSAFLAYQGVSFAPRGPNVELEEIGERFSGRGPALSTEVSIYGPRHFLRKLEVEGASDRRNRPVLLTSGAAPEKGQAVDLDEIQTSELGPYNLLVVRRAPAASRPPADFVLAYQTPRYDVWQRVPTAPGTLVEHLPLGTSLDAGDVPDCAEAKRLAAQAGGDGKLVAARVGTPIAVDFTAAYKPSGWTDPTTYTFSPSGSGELGVDIEVPGGEYELWLGGRIYGTIALSLDGEKAASERAVVENVGALDPLGVVELAPGMHRLTARYSGADLHPGSAEHPDEIGPLLLEAPESGEAGLLTLRPSAYQQLCGKRWDWIEAYN
jgi:hypothetical protein